MQELRFEWNFSKAETNIKKHGVPFEEAVTVFDDPMFITFIDQEHSYDEDRYITIGLSNSARLLMIAHTDRSGLIRVISARKATKKEQLFYEKFE